MAIVFVLHGMGKHEKGWWAGDNGTLANLKKLKRYDSIEDHETLQEKLMQFEWVELLYDQHIEKLRTAPNNSAGFSDLLSDIKADDNFKNPSEQVLTAWKDEWLKTSESLNPFNTNDFLKDAAWDVYLVSLPLTRHYLAVKLATDILKKLNARSDKTEPWSILAHSLGTALIRDVLDLIYEYTMEKDPIIGKAECVALLANFSRTIVGDILVTHDPVSDETSVWPSQKRGSSVCECMISARHYLDPLSYLGEDLPVKDWGENTPPYFAKNSYRVFTHNNMRYIPSDLELEDFDSESFIAAGGYLHSVENYFSDPRIHLNFLYNAEGISGQVSKALETEAYDKFKAERAISSQTILGALTQPGNSLKDRKKWFASNVLKLLAKIWGPTQ